MDNKKIEIVMLCGEGRSSRIMYNGLSSCSDMNIKCVIIENKPSGINLIQRRIKKLGLLKTIGQLLFLIYNKFSVILSNKKINQLIYNYGLIDNSFDSSIVKKVTSINNDEVISMLKTLRPDAVVVNGTRIISTSVLSSIDTPFINTHMGITPKYRGVHGGYWAFANDDACNSGVTVHLIDQGIDTGGVLYQDIISIGKYDNFNTYPIHQIAKAIPLMIKALKDIKENKVKVKEGVFPSRLWYHPTLFEYIKNNIKNGVK